MENEKNLQEALEEAVNKLVEKAFTEALKKTDDSDINSAEVIVNRPGGQIKSNKFMVAIITEETENKKECITLLNGITGSDAIKLHEKLFAHIQKEIISCRGCKK